MFSESFILTGQIVYFTTLLLTTFLSCFTNKGFYILLKYMMLLTGLIALVSIINNYFLFFIVNILVQIFVIYKIKKLNLKMNGVIVVLLIQICINILLPLEYIMFTTSSLYDIENSFQLLFFLNIFELIYILYNLLGYIYERIGVSRFLDNITIRYYQLSKIIQTTKKERKKGKWKKCWEILKLLVLTGAWQQVDMQQEHTL